MCFSVVVMEQMRREKGDFLFSAPNNVRLSLLKGC